jgi:CHAD domain-containing protein
MPLSTSQSDVPTAERPVAEVARQLLSARLDAFWQQLEFVHRDRASRPRDVHQLRVAARRAMAALDLFQPLLARGCESWFRQQLRRIRRSAGKARDVDAIAERLIGEGWSEQAPLLSTPSEVTEADESLESCPQPKADWQARACGADVQAPLFAILARCRERWRRPLEKRAATLVHEETWSQRGAALLSEEGRQASEPFRVFASRRLRPVMRRFFRAADHRLRGADELHALRIRGKKLRYALELCHSSFGDEAWLKCTVALENLQETLGGFTDHAVAAERLDRWARAESGRRRRLMVRLSRDERRTARTAREAFITWWKPSRRRRLRHQCERLLRGD